LKTTVGSQHCLKRGLDIQSIGARAQLVALFFILSLPHLQMSAVSNELHRPIVIAHRGASGYLPEHTLAAKAMAHAMGADFIEQDVVLTRDGVPIVLHDIHLEYTTDVANRFPDYRRSDGHFYAIDLTLAQIRQLQAHERVQINPDGSRAAAFPDRYPLQTGILRIPTLAEEIDLIAGMDRSRGKQTGLYIELKAPNFHLKEGLDIASNVLKVLTEKGYAQSTAQVYLQSFDDQVLRYLREELDCKLPLIQLIADPAWGEDSAVDYSFLQTDAGLDSIAKYADGIGPWYRQIYLGRNEEGEVQLSELVSMAHKHGLKVHPYTLRLEDIPAGIHNFENLMQIMLEDAGVDGFFTDFPDLARSYIDKNFAAP
jgi:glycerophosphoryl diester phosphodiesterase